ncbi:unnamed protein product [Rotaria sordida]|uniref:HNH/Endo VII superfamily nuclease toxins domain-containing protein n=1 Tax=Rotaria sordida TaxID=392033 RepID=A0A820FQR6_9BILA|nr:unnamed protein product [Rotaria sordida]
MCGRKSRPDTDKPTFNNKADTSSTYRSEALNKAKDANGIARAQSPKSTTYVPEIRHGSPTGNKLRQYGYASQTGGSVTIRQDPATKYPDGESQKPHFNAGQTDEKLDQHHYFEKTNKK